MVVGFQKIKKDYRSMISEDLKGFQRIWKDFRGFGLPRIPTLGTESSQ
jgi:hypothetical protein